jgi:hypothetical protein
MYARVSLILVILLVTGCAADDGLPQASETDATVVADIAFTVSKEARPATRMSAAVVQEEGQAYRGIEMQHIVPFAIASAEKVTASDMPKAFQVFGDGEQPVDSRAYYYYDNCKLMSGVNAFLCYGCAPQTSSDKHVNGSLMETFPADMAPKDIRFSLEAITDYDVHPTATALANYMTAIATAEGNGVKWRDATNATLGVMYLNFLNKIEEDVGEPLPGSATNISVYTQTLKSTLENLSLTDDTDLAIRTAIITAIGNYNDEWNGFPGSIGLPDGAAVIRWTGTEFEPQINTTTLADINGIGRYAYPAELYYYGNSRIYTSTIDKREDKYTDREWNTILADYEYADGVVSPNTTSVAIKEPLQYGVAHVQIILKKTDSSTLKDAGGADIPVGDTNFPLTGVVIGGQLPVGFDFTPTTAYPVYSEADMKFIYDNQLPTLCLSSSADATQHINTLVLQTYDNKKVPVALEFTNNSGLKFKGLGGDILNGTKFYLVGEIDPEEFKDDDRTEIRDRVFTQDYTTILNMKVTGLEKAYNVVPNLLSPRLEMGVVLIPKWVATTPDEVLF